MNKTEGRYSFQVTDRTGDSLVSNALRFDLVTEAQAYGDDLLSRWMAIKEWRVFDTIDNKPVAGTHFKFGQYSSREAVA